MTIAWSIPPILTSYQTPVRVFVLLGEAGVALGDDSKRSRVGGSQQPNETEIGQRLSLHRRLVESSGSRVQTSINRAIIFMQDNLERPISLDDVAREAALSKYHFARCFKTMTGYPPRAYLTLLRIECAARLISSSDTPIADIAAVSGFGSASSLSHVFKRKLGLTPTQLRGIKIVFVPTLLPSRE